MAKQIGRRPGGQPTRREIVASARGIFAVRGFRGSTVRAIAEAADVDPALIHHYFGTKEHLFAATLEFPEHGPDDLVAALVGPPEDLGERLTRAYLELWENSETRDQMAIATRAALSSDDAMARVRSTVVNMLGQAATTDLPGPDPEKRFALATAHLFGVAVIRHVSKVPPLRDLPLEEVIARTAPAVQLHLTGN